MRVFHVLSQRPSLTGSGITLDAVVRHAASSGWEQRVAVGTPTEELSPAVGGLPPDQIHPLVFGSPPLDFHLPGMSDVMPYPSTRFSSLNDIQLAAYRQAWTDHLRPIIEGFRPHLIHSHHLWIVSALLKDVAPNTPVISHCHATGFRQMELCPHLAEDVRSGCARNDGFFVLHSGHASQLVDCLGVESNRVHMIGAGYRDDLFHARGVDPLRRPALLYAGKYSASKGLPQLLDAFGRLRIRYPELRLHIVGDGAGTEADALRDRMDGMAPAVIRHGRLQQSDLAKVARQATVFVLPSFYEGLPLVLVEALACGCRLVATALPGIQEELAPRLGTALRTVPLPPFEGIDTPVAEKLPGFVNDLETALEQSLASPPLEDPNEALPHFTWAEVFGRIEKVWRTL